MSEHLVGEYDTPKLLLNISFWTFNADFDDWTFPSVSLNFSLVKKDCWTVVQNEYEAKVVSMNFSMRKKNWTNWNSLTLTKHLLRKNNNVLDQSAGAVEYTDCFSAPPPPTTTCVLDMILNSLMVRFQWCWRFWNCGVPLHCHRF